MLVRRDRVTECDCVRSMRDACEFLAKKHAGKHSSTVDRLCEARLEGQRRRVFEDDPTVLTSNMLRSGDGCAHGVYSTLLLS